MCCGEEHRLHKPHWLSTSASLMMYTLGLGQSQKRGIGTHCREGEREIVQTGERKNQKGEGGGGAEETNRDAPSRITLPEGQLPAGDRAERSQSRSCIPLGAARLSDRSERPKSPRTLEKSRFSYYPKACFRKAVFVKF